MNKLYLARAGLLAVIGGTAFLCRCSAPNSIIRMTHDAAADGRFVTEDSRDRFETVVDSKTGVTYLVWNRGEGSSMRGGITPLLDEDGKPVIDERSTDV